MTKEPKERTYFLEFAVLVEYTGTELPDDDIIIGPIKKYAKKHLKAYEKTSKITNLKISAWEDGYEEEIVEEDVD